MSNNEQSIIFSIVVPTKDRDDVLFDCIQSISSQTHKPLEVIVIDDGQILPETMDAIGRQLARVDIAFQYRQKTDPGLSESKNLGATLARGDILVFLDDDVTLDPNYLKGLADIWKNHGHDSRLAGVGGMFSNGRYISNAEKVFNRIFSLSSSSHNKDWSILPWGFQTMNHKLKASQEADWLPGGNSSYRRTIILQFPFFPLKPGRTALEDIDHSWQIKKAGYRLMLTPKSQMIHWATPIGREKAWTSGFKEASNRRLIFKRHGQQTLGNRIRFTLAAVGSVLKKFMAGITQPRLLASHWRYGLGMINGYLNNKTDD